MEVASEIVRWDRGDGKVKEEGKMAGRVGDLGKVPAGECRVTLTGAEFVGWSCRAGNSRFGRWIAEAPVCVRAPTHPPTYNFSKSA